MKRAKGEKKMKSKGMKYFWRSMFAVSLAIAAFMFVGIADFNNASVAAPRVETSVDGLVPVNVTALVAVVDLTGVWSGDDGATYYIRHIPRKQGIVKIFNGVAADARDDVYWFGQGKGFGNVFHGMISKGQVDQISGEWADVPIGGAKNSGLLTITIASKDRLVLMGEPGNFAAREWKRVAIKPPNLPQIPLQKPNN